MSASRVFFQHLFKTCTLRRFGQLNYVLKEHALAEVKGLEFVCIMFKTYFQFLIKF